MYFFYGEEILSIYFHIHVASARIVVNDARDWKEDMIWKEEKKI